VIVRVGEETAGEYVPVSHAVELIELAFPRDELARLLREMAVDRLVDQWAKAGNIEISPREVRSQAAPVHEEEPLLEKISLAEILKLAQASEQAMQDRARRELQLKALVRKTIPEDAVKQEFEAHRDWYLGRSVRLGEVFIGFVDPETGRLRSPEERDEAVRRLEAIKKELEGDGDFEKLAFAYSEDASALRGGDIGWFPQLGVLGEALNAPALELDRHEVAGPIESSFGIHLIKVIEVKKHSGSSLSDEAVQKRIMDNLVREKLPQWSTEHLEQATIQVFPDRL